MSLFKGITWIRCLQTFPPSIEKKEYKIYLHQVFYGFAYNLHVLELKDSKYVASVDDRNAWGCSLFGGQRKEAGNTLVAF